jgi:glyoxylase-like metal-dependent hydrolase (beta-lactamase superfamily II)
MVSRITLVRAPNPSAMTLSGTNSYLVDVGNGEGIVIDPGPAIMRHIDALIGTARERDLRIVAILLTHGHPDHAPAATLLAQRTRAPVYAHPQSEAPHDRNFDLDTTLHIADAPFFVMDAPGHTFEHIVLYDPRERALFTGDVILGEGTVVIAPPGGAMRPYQHTLARLRDEFPQARYIYGGHGERVDDAQAKITEYIAHRELRQRELLNALADGPKTIPELVMDIYGVGKQILWPAMARQMLAYLMALEDEGVVSARRIERPMTHEEIVILNPAWETIVGREQAEVIEAELGAMHKLDRLYEYRLRPSTSSG